MSEYLQQKKVLIYYVRNTKCEPIGVIIITKDGEALCLGWSKCNIKCERFNRYIGFQKALQRMKPVLAYSAAELFEMPNQVRRGVEYMYERANKYFYKNESGVAAAT